MRKQPRWFYETLYIHKKLFEGSAEGSTDPERTS